MADIPSPPLCPTRDKNNWKMCKTPPHPSPLPLHQENFIESMLARNAGADTVS